MQENTSVEKKRKKKKNLHMIIPVNLFVYVYNKYDTSVTRNYLFVIYLSQFYVARIPLHLNPLRSATRGVSLDHSFERSLNA